MSSTDGRTSAWAEAADQLERWADTLPRQSEGDDEPWYEFVNRRYEAEVALIERLRCAPHCRFWACSMRISVEMSLGGIYVRTDQGLEAALREWARQARERSGP